MIFNIRHLYNLSCELQLQAWSNLLWALATLQENGVDLGSSSNVSAIVAAGAAAMGQRISTASPQALANTLWALATLGWHRDDSTLTKLVTAMVQRISSAKPQDLSNTVGTGHPWLAP